MKNKVIPHAEVRALGRASKHAARKLALAFLFALSFSPAFAQVPLPATIDEALALFQNGNYSEARKIAEDFAAKDDPRGQILLGTMAQKGLGQEVDLKQAQVWFQKGADKGDVDSELALAMLLLTGTTGKPDVIDAAPWLQKAAEQGNVKAEYNLGIYYTGAFGTQADWANASKWFKAAADKGSARAQYNLGLLNLDGKGVDKNQLAAADWFSKAAVQGLAAAALEYGVLIFRGEGVAKDEVVGTKWLKVAAERGNAVAQNRLARVLGVGVPGVPQDPVEAMKWNFLAGKAGRGDVELDAATEKADPPMVQQARHLADNFKPTDDLKPE